MKRCRAQPGDERGSVLVPVLLIALLLGGLSFGLLTEGLAEQASVSQRRSNLAAMAIYAPGAGISVHGNDDVFGSFVGEFITVAGNSSFHYDSSLGDSGRTERVTLERLYWRDLHDPVR